MAVKRELHVTLTGDGTITINGDSANSVATAWQSYESQGYPKGVTVKTKDIEGEESAADDAATSILFKCYCRMDYTRTESEAPDRECNDPGCNLDYNPTPPTP